MNYFLVTLPLLICVACNSPGMNRLELLAVDMGDGDFSAYYVPVAEPLVADAMQEEAVRPAFQNTLLADEFQLFPIPTLEALVHDQDVSVVRMRDRNSLRSQQIVGRDGNELLVEPVFQISSAHMSPSKAFIAFSCKETPSASWSIWVINRDGSQPRLLTFGKDPMWINDNALVFTAKHNDHWAIQRCNANGGQRQLLVSGDQDCLQPRVSPDSQSIAYMKASDIWRCRVTGKMNTQLTRHPARDDSPVWAEDGKTLYFRSTRNGRWGVWQVTK